jgi:hypothetical protein
MFGGPKALPQTFPTWPDAFRNIFVLRGISDDSTELDSSLEKVRSLQQELAERLEKLPSSRRKACLFPGLNKGEKIDIPMLPVIIGIDVLSDGILLMQTAASLHESHTRQSLMTDDGRLLLPTDGSLPGSVFNSRHSSSQQLSPRQSNIDLQIFQGHAALVQMNMRSKDDLISLCGGAEIEKYIPAHPSIGMLNHNFTLKVIRHLKLCRHFPAESAVCRFQCKQGQENQYASCIHFD